MSTCNNNHITPQRSSSWAKVAGDGKGQQQLSTENWPVVKHSLVTQPNTEQVKIKPLEDQIQKLKNEVEQLKADATLHAAEREADSAKILKLETTLNDTRRKILSLQPPQDISDDQVKQAFDDLCENIEDFVDVNCGGLLDLEDRFRTQDWTDLEVRITEFHITEDDIKLAKEFPKIATNIMMNAIFSLVYEYGLREDSWIALAEKRKEEEFLNTLVEIMSTQKGCYNAPAAGGLQSRLKFADNPQLRRWRSEVFRALKGADYHESKRKSGLSECGRKAYLMLQHFVDEGKSTTIEKLKSKIIEPAYRLADMIKGSTSGYRFGFVVNSSNCDIYLEALDKDLHKLVDAHTGTEDDFEVTTEGRIGRLRLCIFPSLEKVLDGGERVCMSRALVVIDKTSKEDSMTVTDETVVSEGG